MSYEALFGTSTLKGKEGDVAVSTLEGKHLLVYFSAHWCPPCRGFTPTLSEYYKKHAANKDFELVFVSSDHDEAAFNEYYGEMPWLALPFSLRNQKEKLSKKFKVQGIPSLVVIAPGGELVTDKGRAKMTEDPECENFPWKPLTYSEIMAKTAIIDGQGNKQDVAAITSKVHGLYFSAHWCPPCRSFTPQLVKTYNIIKEAGKDFEIIFVSSDRDQSSFDEYFGEMPWKAMTFEDRASKAALSDAFGVEGIPSFQIVDGNGKVITDDARSAVSGDPEGKEFPWYPKPMNDLKDGPGAINDLPSLVVVCDGCDEATKTKAMSDLKTVAEAHWAENPEEKKFAFFTLSEADGIGGKVKELCKIEGDGIKVMMLEVPKYYVSEMAATSVDGLTSFMQKFSEGHTETPSGTFGA